MRRWKKVLAFLIAFMMALPTEFLGMGTVAYAAEQVQIATPSDVMWKTDATATATWSKSAEANYYDVKVLVYTPDETFIGETVTGTTETVLDVQQEINRIMGDSYKKVLVQFAVRGAVKGEGETAYGEWSANSAMTEYSLESIVYQLGVPANVTLSNDLVASWDVPLNMEKDSKNYYTIYYELSDGSTTVHDTTTSSKASFNITERVATLYNKSSFINTKVNVRIKVCASSNIVFGNGTCLSGTYSEFTSTVVYDREFIYQLGIPQNVQMDENLNVTWDASVNMELNSNNYYALELEVSDGNVTAHATWTSRETSSNLKETFLRALIDNKTIARTNLQARCRVLARAVNSYGGVICKESEYSSYTPWVACTNITTVQLGVPTNIRWSEGTVLSWDASENMNVDPDNYYSITVHASSGDRKGFASLITRETSVDLKSTIQKAYATGNFATTLVTVNVTIRANKPSFGDSLCLSSESYEFPETITYQATPITKLGKVTNAHISDEYILTWDEADHFDESDSFYYYFVVTCQDGKKTTTDSYVCHAPTYDAKALVQSAYTKGDYGNRDVDVYFRVKASVSSYEEEGLYYASGEDSEYSNVVTYAPDGVYYLRTPETVKLSDAFVASWNSAKNMERDARNYYLVEYTLTDGVKSYTNSTTTTNTSVDLSARITDYYNRYFTDNQPVSVTIRVKATNNVVYGEGTCIAGEYSAYSNAVTYTPKVVYQLGNPANLTLSRGLIATWNPAENMEKDTYNYYSITISMTGQGRTVTDTTTSNTNSIDLTDRVTGLYNRNGFNGTKVSVCYKVQASTNSLYGNGTCVSSAYSAYSDPVPFADHKLVETVSLSPKAPILYLGNSFFLGKTINPEDAYYTSIDWASSDAETVSVSDMGEICGLQVGNATVTATIEDASDSVQVRVYDIASNITDEDTRKEVTDLAGDILDDLNNNDNPNLDNTDITEDTLPDVKEDIEQGMERGDEFATDATVEEKDASDDLADAIEEEIDSAEVVGAYELAIEVYHRSNKGEVYHITTIGKTDKGIDYNVTVPKDRFDELSNRSGKYEFVYLDAGVLKKQEVTPDKDGSFQFTTNISGEYALVYEEEIEQIDVRMKGFSLNLEDQIGINFYLEIPEWIRNTEGAILECNIEGELENLYLDELTPVEGQTDTYLYTRYVPASCMTKVAGVTVMIPDAKTGYRTGETFTFSIREYANILIANPEKYGQKAADLAAAMLNYGAYAQLYFHEKTDLLANDGLFEHQKNPVSENIKDISDRTVRGAMENELIHFYGASLLCKANTYVKLYFEANPGRDIRDTYMRYQVSATRNGEKATVMQTMVEEEGYYVLYIKNIAPAELDDTYQITLTDRTDNKTSTISFEYSPMNYIAGAQKSTNKALVELTRAMYYYNRAAEAYYR